jgi:MFS family permease
MLKIQSYRINRAAILLMAAIFFYGVIYNAWSLFLNLFVLARGFDREFLGLANMMPAAAALVLGIPLGMFADKIGQKKAMWIGLASSAAACGLMTAAADAPAIMAASFLWGSGTTLFTICQAPFMMKISDESNRLALFSLNGSLQILAGVFGNYLAGIIPGIAAGWLKMSDISPAAYQAVFLFCALVGIMGLLPIHFIRVRETRCDAADSQLPASGNQDAVNPGIKWIFTGENLKLLAPNFIIGAGAGLLIPYLNVFYIEKFGLGNESLGFLFSLSALITGAGMLAGPLLAKWCGGKIKLVALVQLLSLGFMLLAGFSNWFILSAIGFLIRAMLINIAPPVWSAFVMEQTPPGRQATMSSFQNLVWTAGWFCGPYLSGIVQNRYGFGPLFIATSGLYAGAVVFTWFSFRESELKNRIDSISMGSGAISLPVSEGK